MRMKMLFALAALVMFSVALPSALSINSASAAPAVPKEQVKSFVCDSKSVKDCATSVDAAVNEWISENSAVTVLDRKVSLAVGGPTSAQVSSLAYAVTIFYSGGRPQ